MHCIVTGKARRRATGVHGQVGSATIRPEKGPRHGAAGLRHGRRGRMGERRARKGLVAGGVCRDRINCILTGGRLCCWVVSRDRRDTAGRAL